MVTRPSASRQLRPVPSSAAPPNDVCLSPLPPSFLSPSTRELLPLLSGCSSAVRDALAEILLWLRAEPLPKETVARMTQRAEQLSLPDRDILCQILALAVCSNGGEA